MTGNLFDENPVTRQPVVNPAARAKDPASSHEAAKRMKDSGQAQAQAVQLLGFLRSRYPVEFTTREIAHEIGMCRYAVARRMPELRDQPGRAVVSHDKRGRECRIGGKRVGTWRATAQ